MDTALEQVVWRRAKSRCEYCQLPQSVSPLTHAIDHIIARKHHGPTQEDNLALSCFFCNSFKGPNISGVDPQTGRMVRLFHPRKDRWKRHFVWNGPYLVGRTSIGRTTIAVLEINDSEAVNFRESLIREGSFPPLG